MADAQNWIDSTILHWKSQKIELEEGASESDIVAAQAFLDMQFPESFVALYKKVNGFKNWDWTENLFSMWPLQRIKEEYDFSADKNFIGFCDYLIMCHCIGFYKETEGVYKEYDKTKPIALNFEEAINLINTNSELIY